MLDIVTEILDAPSDSVNALQFDEDWLEVLQKSRDFEKTVGHDPETFDADLEEEWHRRKQANLILRLALEDKGLVACVRDPRTGETLHLLHHVCTKLTFPDWLYGVCRKASAQKFLELKFQNLAPATAATLALPCASVLRSSVPWTQWSDPSPRLATGPPRRLPGDDRAFPVLRVTISSNLVACSSGIGVSIRAARAARRQRRQDQAPARSSCVSSAL